MPPIRRAAVRARCLSIAVLGLLACSREPEQAEHGDRQASCADGRAADRRHHFFLGGPTGGGGGMRR
ncbi:MAG TPA: hypothetical protein VM869_26575, partial [Enhygromyxa sp.]|nr:hypothetical protein [Enhygromyxa sp.]